MGISPSYWLDGVDGSEATDHLSQTQISDVNVAVTNAGQQGGNSAFNTLQSLMGQIPGHQSRELSAEMSNVQRVASRAPQRDFERATSQTGEFDPETIAMEIYPILEFRDRVVKFIDNTIDKVL